MIIYLHGFNSSPASHKAQLLGQYLAARGLQADYASPALPPWPAQAIATAEAAMAGRAPESVCFVGSSLGGYYATHLVEKHGARAVLINPAIDPDVGLRAFLGTQQNLHTGERYELTEEHLAQWGAIRVPRVTAARYLLIVETGDEVLDYRKAVERYRGAAQIVIEGGDHSLRSFPQHLDRILAFSGMRSG